MDEEGQALLMADLRTIGLLVEACLGCKKIDCDSCPCGTGTMINPDALSSVALGKLKEIYAARKKARTS